MNRYYDLVDAIFSLKFVFKSNIILIGDFNIPEYSSYLRRLLDMVISNMSCEVQKSDENLVAEDAHHPSLLVTVKSPIRRTSFIKGVIKFDSLNFRKVDIALLNDGISSIDWSSLYNCSDVNLACKLINKIKMKSKFWKKYKTYRNEEDYNEYRKLRKDIKGKLARLYKEYVAKVENQISSDPNKFWQFIKFKTNGPGEIVHAFSEMFKSVYNPHSCIGWNNSPTDNFNLSQLVSLIPVSEHDVIEAMHQLKPKYTAGPDQIPALIIRECADSLARPLKVLFNLCLESASFPDMWKDAKTDVIYLDLSKAFDKLDHSILLTKLSNMGCTPRVVEFFSSYLCNRKQYVFVHGFSSEEFIATSGVPQGSVLGPLLFNLFINDLVAELNVPCLLYADDIKIFTIIRNPSDCETLQNNLDFVTKWCRMNKLPVNKNKCVVMSFGLKFDEILWNYTIKDFLLSRPENMFRGRTDGFYPSVGYSQIILLERFAVQTLTQRNCPSLLAQINFHVNVRSYSSRQGSLFYNHTPRTNVLKYSPLQTMCRLGNYVNLHLDLFHTTVNELRSLEYSDLS
ncbi:uncharacterized protein LOC135120487 [Zophobas morio]|uniref:uncharacterized protein LOC135120487 n=1 Tax=Zophobas morio TaxID=2755281 RepID=UPI0030831698